MNIIHAYLLARDSNDWTELAEILINSPSKLAESEYLEVRELIAKKMTNSLQQKKPKTKPFEKSASFLNGVTLTYLFNGAGFPIKEPSSRGQNQVSATALAGRLILKSPSSVIDYWKEQVKEIPDELSLGMMSLKGVEPWRATIRHTNSREPKWQSLPTLEIENLVQEFKEGLKEKRAVQIKQYDAWILGRILWLSNSNSKPKIEKPENIFTLLLELKNIENLILTAKQDWFTRG